MTQLFFKIYLLFCNLDNKYIFDGSPLEQSVLSEVFAQFEIFIRAILMRGIPNSCDVNVAGMFTYLYIVHVIFVEARVGYLSRFIIHRRVCVCTLWQYNQQWSIVTVLTAEVHRVALCVKIACRYRIINLLLYQGCYYSNIHKKKNWLPVT